MDPPILPSEKLIEASISDLDLSGNLFCRIECTSPINRNIYAVNYNILKIRDGMASIMYTD